MGFVIAPPARQTYFATGGGIGGEYTPTPRMHLRASVAERVVRFRPDSATTCSVCVPATDRWREVEVFSAGVWMGVGGQVRGDDLLREPLPVHRFVDRTNVLLILGATLAGVTDAVATHRFLDKGLSEGDPLERPFVQNGNGGFVALGVITETAAIGFMYGRHHMGHHFLERLLPATIIVGEARTSYRVVKNLE